jgi:nitrogen-specific signal transduction histidine kinase
VIGREVGPNADWKTILPLLKQYELWEFREEQIDRNGNNTVLQTSKWPLWINNNIYVVVIYSDVTKGDAEQQRIHHDTVHTIRGAAQPLDTSLTLLRDLINEAGPNDSSRLCKVERLMAYAKDDLEWFLAHHLDLMRSEVDLKPICLSKLHEIADKALKYIDVVSQGTVYVTLKQCADSVFYVLGDETRLTAVIRELTRNAYEAVRGRISVFDLLNVNAVTLENLKAEGWNLFNLSAPGAIEIDIRVSSDTAVIEIRDNGEAAYNPSKRFRLHEKLSIFRMDPKIETFRLGLAFCLRTAHSHHGTLVYEHSDRVSPLTIMKISLPLAKKSDTI